MKKLILIIISIALLFSFVACGSNEKEISRLNGLLEEKTEQLEEKSSQLLEKTEEKAGLQEQITALTEQNFLVKQDYRAYKDGTENVNVVYYQDNFALRIRIENTIAKTGWLNVIFDLIYLGEEPYVIPDKETVTTVAKDVSDNFLADISGTVEIEDVVKVECFMTQSSIDFTAGRNSRCFGSIFLEKAGKFPFLFTLGIGYDQDHEDNYPIDDMYLKPEDKTFLTFSVLVEDIEIVEVEA